MVPVSCCAGCWIRGQVRTQPLLLWRANAATDEGAVAIEHHNMPATQVVAVVALSGLTSGRSEVVEVAGRPGSVVVMVASRRRRPCLMAAPGRVIVVGELGVRAGTVGVVPQREYRAWDSIQQFGRRLVTRPAGGYITSAYQNWVNDWRRRGSGRGRWAAVRVPAVEHLQVVVGAVVVADYRVAAP